HTRSKRDWSSDVCSTDLATFTVNMMGCFLLSFLLNNKQFKTKVNPKIFLGLSTGLIGSFTTFSTFSIETIELLGASFFLATFYEIGRASCRESGFSAVGC